MTIKYPKSKVQLVAAYNLRPKECFEFGECLHWIIKSDYDQVEALNMENGAVVKLPGQTVGKKCKIKIEVEYEWQ